jgi:hypothetical protein
MNWQPIETAPTAAVIILGYDPHRNIGVCKMFFSDYFSKWIRDGERPEVLNPTHWMPLPEPPK